ncbi:hypothetical protein [Arthrobacter sp. NA-172]|uniref:hypothetical protein n=1 Tax=Arthrobacter sp. NA-172 TaxID=3367524 RepID=UPI003755367A
MSLSNSSDVLEQEQEQDAVIALIRSLRAAGQDPDSQIDFPAPDPEAVSQLIAYAAQALTLGKKIELNDTAFSPTDAVIVATAVLRTHDLTPFELALWFQRSDS